MWRDRPLSEALEAVRALGLASIELAATPDCLHLDPLGGRDTLVKLRADLQGFEVTAVAADHPHLARREEEGGDEAVAHTVGAIKRAGDLGAPVVVMTLGATDVDAWDTAWERAFVALRMVLYQTARSRVNLAILISADDVLNSIRKARRLLDAIDNPRLGIAVDTGYLHYLRIQLTEVLLVAGERLHHVRLRDATRTDFDRPIGTGEVNFAAAVKQLRQHGYQGALSLNIPNTDSATLTESLSFLQPLLTANLTPSITDSAETDLDLQDDDDA